MSSSSLFSKALRLATTSALACVFVCTALFAQDREPTPVVEYRSSLTQIQGQLPITRSYDISITSPYTASSVVPVVIPLVVTPNGIPSGVADALAIGYVTFSANGLPVTALTFTGPNQAKTLTVNVNIPANATPGSYGYKILATGWISALVNGVLTPPENVGTFINATVTAPPAPPPPPVVEITSPIDGSVITVPVGGLPLQVPLTFVANVDTSGVIAPITNATVEFNGSSLTLSSLTGISTTSVAGAGTLTITAPGIHTVTALATNAGGTATDVVSFRVVVTAAPPTVVINTPTPNSVYTYRTGSPALIVPFTFTANSQFGGIRTLTAKVNGVLQTFSPSGLGTLTATGTINLPHTTAGTHTLEVTTTDDYGTATATSNYTVNVIAPTPNIDITNPLNGAVFNLPSGASSMSIPYTFVSTSNNGFFVDSVSASLDATTTLNPATTGLGTATANSSGTMLNVTAGTHTILAKAVSAGIEVTDSVTFTVRSSAVPPTVVINTPPVGSVYVRASGGPALAIPLTFTGQSQTPGAVITRLTASLNGTTLSVTPSNLNTATATGAATMNVTNAGTYTISVTATDAYGTAATTRTFKVEVVQGRSVCGEVFFDVDFDGTEDCGEFGLAGVTVKIYNSSNVLVGTDVTDNCGGYSFSNLPPGTYKVIATAPTGLKGTTVLERTITITNCNVCVPDIGLGLNFDAIRGMTATGYTIGYWKNNLDKAISGKTSGIQVSKSTLESYTCKIGDFALSPYDCISMKTASSTMNYSGSTPTSLLSKQLIASEYNYQNGAYLNGNKNLTMLFIWWGEYILANPSKYSSTYILKAKDWFDAYNNTHAGPLVGPSNP